MNFKDYLKLKKMDAETYFDKTIKSCKDLDVLPNELADCRCCERHVFNFPALECKLPALPKPDNFINPDCNCPCRHIARHVCREWDLINEVEDLESDENSDESEVDSEDSINDFIVSDDETQYEFNKEARHELRKIVDKIKGKSNLKAR